MHLCNRIPCGATSGGCAYTDCPQRPLHPHWALPNTPIFPPAPPMGCICPPTAEQTCGNPVCPRKPPPGYVAPV
jgi:hypothetical protein